MAEQVGMSHNYLAKRLRGEMPFDVADLDRLSPVLHAEPGAILTSAQHSMHRSDWGLAAKEQAPDVDEGDYL